MFSNITIASSTTKPTDSVRASSVMLLIEKLNAYITAQVAIREIGTASAGMMVAEIVRRNRKMTSTTRLMAIRRVSCTSWTDSRTEMERSIITSIAMEAGTCERYAGRRSFTESTTATVLASGW